MRNRKLYRTRKHLNPEDLGCVPLDSIETDNPDEFWRFISNCIMEGRTVEWSCRKSIRKELDRVFGKMSYENIYAY